MSDERDTVSGALGALGALGADVEGAEAALARRLDLPRVAWRTSVPSTMDEAHALAADGAPAGTLVIADMQSRGRGRGGREWTSRPGAGLWMTLLERPLDASGLDVLSLRVGLRAAQVLDRFAPAPVQLKWPNDLMLPDGKVGGILVEARWRERRPEWVAIGIGVNLERPPRLPHAASLGTSVPREEVLAELVPAIRSAAAARGPLTARELEEFAGRDWARDRHVVAPAVGTVAGISPAGALLIATPQGVVSCTSGSLVIEGATA